MDALRTGIYTFFTAAPGGVHNDFYTALNGRLFFGEAPEGTNLSDGPYGIFFFVSDTNNDVFAGQGKDVYVQFSLFSGDSSPAVILDMDKDLSTLYKDTSFAVTGWTVINMKRVQGNGPLNIPADTESGTGRYWMHTVDFEISLHKT